MEFKMWENRETGGPHETLAKYLAKELDRSTMRRIGKMDGLRWRGWIERDAGKSPWDWTANGRKASRGAGLMARSNVDECRTSVTRCVEKVEVTM